MSEEQPGPAVDAESVEQLRAFLRDKSASVEEFLAALGGLGRLFAHLGYGEVQTLTFQVVDRIFRSEQGEALLCNPEHAIFIHQGLVHSDERVAVFTIKQLSHLLRTQSGLKYVLEQGELYLRLVSLLGDDSTACAEEAAAFLVRVSEAPVGLERLVGDEVTAALEAQAAASDLVLFRVLTLAVRVASHSAAVFVAVRDRSPWLQRVTELIKSRSDDLLVQFNLMQLLEQLAQAPGGAEFLVSSGATVDLIKLVNEPMIAAPAMGMLASLAASGGRFWDSLSGDFFVQFLRHDDANVSAATAALVSAIACHEEGLCYLVGLERVFPALLALVRSQDERERLSSIHALARVMSGSTRAALPPVSPQVELPQPGAAVSEMRAAVFGAVDERTHSAMFDFLSTPWEDVRGAVYALYYAAAAHAWSLRFFSSWPGMLEFLLNRKTENSKVGLEWKFAILQRLGAQPALAEAVPESLAERIREYVAKGPFFVKAESRVLVGGT